MKNYTYLTAGNEDVQNVCKQMSNQNKTYMYEFDYRQKELFNKNRINNLFVLAPPNQHRKTCPYMFRQTQAD